MGQFSNDMARAFNDCAAEAIKTEDRFIAVPWIYPPDMQIAISGQTRKRLPHN
jgi:hypothetical protein